MSFRAMIVGWLPRGLGVLATTLLLGGVLAACGNMRGQPADSYPDRDAYERYRYGSLSGGAGFSLFGGGGRERDELAGESGIGVNSYLWRATLDTVAFMPVVSADPFGGVIITDWYSPPNAPQERFKLNVYILDRQLRADGVRVAVFRQALDNRGVWADAAVDPTTARGLEDTILTRARELRVASLGQ